MKKKTYMAPEVKNFMMEPLQVIATSSRELQIVDNEEFELKPTETFSIRQNWNVSDEEEED